MCVFLESQRCVRDTAHDEAQYPLANWAPSQQLRELLIPFPHTPRSCLESFLLWAQGGCGLWGKTCHRVCAEVRGQLSLSGMSSLLPLWSQEIKLCSSGFCWKHFAPLSHLDVSPSLKRRILHEALEGPQMGMSPWERRELVYSVMTELPCPPSSSPFPASTGLACTWYIYIHAGKHPYT